MLVTYCKTRVVNGRPSRPLPVIMVILILAACTAVPENSPGPASNGNDQPSASETESTGSPLGPDPFAYCADVGTIDMSAGDFGGPSNPGIPPAIVPGLRQAAGATDDAPIAENSYWRCMDGKVYACFVGANLSCADKADTSATPTDAMNEFCAAQPDADAIPANVTGRDTVYTWSCVDGGAEAGEQMTAVDAQGYPTNIWYEIDPATTPTN